MTHVVDADVVVGGGGVAGLAAAAAMHQLGLAVVVVEAGLNNARRLAGEVFHPPGVAGLAELGLLPAVRAGPAAVVNGFSLWLNGDCIELPYSIVPAHLTPGISLQHDSIRQRMLNAVSALPNVVMKRDSRVVGIDQRGNSHVTVDVANGSVSTTYRCRMLIAADGTPSRLARLAGIEVRNRRVSTVIGYQLTNQNLPDSKFGHVFLGAATPILVYPIEDDRARILFDIPYQAGRRATATDCLIAAEALPSLLRQEVHQAISMQPRVSLLTQTIDTDRSVNGRVALAGDAGGCCHPITATGMTMCISDALMLREALRERFDDLPAALQLYQDLRRWPQATRLALAGALRDALCASSPAHRVVRNGIFNHLRKSQSNRSATLALLSTADGRPLALLRRLVAVMIRGFAAHLRNPRPVDRDIGWMSLSGALGAMFLARVRGMLQSSQIEEPERQHPEPKVHVVAADRDRAPHSSSVPSE